MSKVKAITPVFMMALSLPLFFIYTQVPCWVWHFSLNMKPLFWGLETSPHFCQHLSLREEHWSFRTHHCWGEPCPTLGLWQCYPWIGILSTTLWHLPHHGELYYWYHLVKTESTIDHWHDWHTILYGPPLVLPRRGLLSLPGSHWDPSMNGAATPET